MADPAYDINLELLEQIAEGDEHAFAVLYAYYSPRLQAYAYKFTKSETNSKEVLQETFLTIWIHRDALPNLEHLQGWIYKIVARHCLQWMRKQRSEDQRIERIVSPFTDIFIPTPADLLQWQELQATIQTALAGLSEIRQQIYHINREEGLKPSAIAARLNMPVGTVKNHLSQALKLIRQHLIEAGYPFILVLKFLTCHFP